MKADEIIKKKQEMQDEIVDLSKIYPRLALLMATGTGKSLAAIRVAERYPDQPCYIVCKETTHIQNWIAEFKKHGKEQILESRVTIFCYDSLHKYKNLRGVLILDEVHAITELRGEYLRTMVPQAVVALSATLYPSEMALLSNIFGSFKKYVVTLQDAIDRGLVPEPKIVITRVVLNKVLYNRVKLFKKGKQKDAPEFSCSYNERFLYLRKLKTFPSYRLHVKCTEHQFYEMLCDDYDYWYHRNGLKTFQIARERKSFLANVKKNYVKTVLDNKSNFRTLVFSSDIKTSKDFHKKGMGIVNSKYTKKQNQETIDEFNSGKIDKLHAVNMLTEGVNMTELEFVVIQQLDSKSRSFIQRLGRSLRHDSPLVHIFYVANTRDEEYLNNAIENINKELIYNERQ